MGGFKLRMSAVMILVFQLMTCAAPNDRPAVIQTLEIYNAPPTFAIHTIDAEDDKLIVWNATFHALPDPSSAVLGDIHGSMFVIKAAGEVEDRLTNIEFDWTNLKDSIVISGVHAYPINALETDQPIHRAIVGGTGNFIGAKGEITSARLDSGWYRHELILVR